MSRKEGIVDGQAVGYIAKSDDESVEMGLAIVCLNKDKKGKSQLFELKTGGVGIIGWEDRIQLSLGGPFDEMIRECVSQKEQRLKSVGEGPRKKIDEALNSDDPLKAISNLFDEMSIK